MRRALARNSGDLDEIERARARQIDRHDVGDPPGTRAQNHDAVGQQHGLGYRMGDEIDGLWIFLADAQQFEAHLLTRERVERAERLVHQQHARIGDKRAADRDALLHAAGQFPAAPCRSKPESPASFSRSSAAFRPAASTPRDSESGNNTLLRTFVHGSRVGVWNTMPTSRRGSVTAAPPMLTTPSVGRDEPRDDPQQGRLATSGRADHHDELAVVDIERDAGERRHLAAIQRFEVRDTVDADRRTRVLPVGSDRDGLRCDMVTVWILAWRLSFVGKQSPFRRNMRRSFGQEAHVEQARRIEGRIEVLRRGDRRVGVLQLLRIELAEGIRRRDVFA